MRDVLFQQITYQIEILRFFAANNSYRREKKEEITKSRKWLLKGVGVSEDLKLSKWRAYADVSLLQFMDGKYEETEILVEEWTSLQSPVPVVRRNFLLKCAQTITLFRSDI